MQNAAGASPSQYDTVGQSRHSGRQARGSTSNQDWRQKHQHCVDVSTVDVGAVGLAANSPSGHHNLPSAVGRPESVTGGQKKGRGRSKPSKDKPSTSAQHRPAAGTPVGPSYQSPAMPQSASTSHQVPRSMSSCS